jgi:hypothetical protein
MTIRFGNKFLESGLDAPPECDWMRLMKKAQIFWIAMVIVSVALATGCVRTVTGNTTAGLPFGKDKVEGRYERSVDQVFTAAKDVLTKNGVLDTESILHSSTNMVKTVVGKVNQRTVYVRVESVTPAITSVVVQARNQNGGADIELSHDIEKQIALRLVSQ